MSAASSCPPGGAHAAARAEPGVQPPPGTPPATARGWVWRVGAAHCLPWHPQRCRGNAREGPPEVLCPLPGSSLGSANSTSGSSAAGVAPALPGRPGSYKSPRGRPGRGTGARGEMDDSSKEALMEEAPPRYTESPRLSCIPHELKSLLLLVALVVVALVVVNVTFLLLGLHLSESHAETVLRMTVQGLDGQGGPQQLAMSKRERTGTFAVRDGLNASATVVYDYGKLLVGYRSWRHRACYITRVDKDNFPGLDAVTESFQRRQDEDAGDKAVPLADRSILGTTINILCSAVPVFWVPGLGCGHGRMLHPAGFALALPPRCWAAEKSPCLGTRALDPVPPEPLELRFPGVSSWEWALSKHPWSGHMPGPGRTPGPPNPSQGPLLSPPQGPSIKLPVLAARLGWEWEEEEEEEEEEEAAAMESSMKQVVLEEEDSGNGCCCQGCCLRCAACCARCCTKCSWCCAKCCCLPKCCRCPKCPKCLKCPKCPGCAGCSGCLKRSLCCLPRLLCYLPRKLLGSCGRLRCLLIAALVVVLLVVVIAVVLLMRLSVDQHRADAVLRAGLWAGAGWEEEEAAFYLDGGDGKAATVVYDYRNLLVSYRPQLHHACFVTRVDKDNVPGLDTVVETFQRQQAEDKISVPLSDRSLLGTTASILCSLLPVYWA
ncbi:pulmonary surfactant-associated protein C [Prinia subflava]|uniref:pulmonary surfactant-associated protein C n=1 Tax=Prinia subflava TaxID=208062 RepID=UPI002FE118E2